MNRRNEILNYLRNFFKERAEEYSLEMVFLYGSWARGCPREDSDIDIGVVFQGNVLLDDDIFKLITEISFKLFVEIKLEVNVVPVYLDFRKPILYYNIIVLGQPLYTRDYKKYIETRNDAIFQMEDFSIFGLKWQFEVAKKNMKEITHA